MTPGQLLAMLQRSVDHQTTVTGLDQTRPAIELLKAGKAVMVSGKITTHGGQGVIALNGAPPQQPPPRAVPEPEPEPEPAEVFEAPAQPGPDPPAVPPEPETPKLPRVSHKDLMAAIDQLAHRTEEDWDVIAIRARRKVDSVDTSRDLLPPVRVRSIGSGWGEFFGPANPD